MDILYPSYELHIFKMAVFWVLAPCSLVEGSKDLRNVGKILPDYTALQSRRSYLRTHRRENLKSYYILSSSECLCVRIGASSVHGYEHLNKINSKLTSTHSLHYPLVSPSVIKLMSTTERAICGLQDCGSAFLQVEYSSHLFQNTLNTLLSFRQKPMVENTLRMTSWRVIK
jgi:hypothetical protein